MLTPGKAEEILTELLAKVEAEEIDDAPSWVVVTECLEFGTRTYTGGFADVQVAIAWADAQDQDLNEHTAPGEAGWVSTVHPMSLPQEVE